MDVRKKLVELLEDAGMGKTERNFPADQKEEQKIIKNRP